MLIKKAEFQCEYNEPFTETGSFDIVGDQIVIENMETFINIGKLASNMEVYPRTDGKLRMSFTFHGLTTPIE